ncbi:MAG: lysylphosphatidylglycerol synthase transmembrane domain-containing protein [Candidatus Saccharibacteria bacterium]|nr:lysylphosphatidylglycerol synthase transmembrane domain-containing protein [Candidatus Saccharibacteria bacterium]
MNKAKKKKLRKIILTILFIAFSAGVIIATAVNEFSGSNEAADLKDVHLNGWLLIPATICFLIMIFLEYGKYALMISRSTPKGTFSRRELWKLSFRTVMLGRYYDNITPAAVGGQPAQILQMRKTGKISNGMATAIPIFSMISGQFTFLLIAIPCFIFSGILFQYPLLTTAAWIGLLFFAFWPVMVLGTMFFPKPTAKFINLIVRFFAKIKIIKNRDEAVKKVEKEVADYAENVKLIIKKPGVGGWVMVMSFFSNIFLSFIPYFVLIAFGGNIDFGEFFLMTTAVRAAVYFAPTPGNAGVAEGTFYIVFSRLSTGYVFWAMMLWRLFSYYVYIIVGPLVYLSMHFEKKRKGRDDHQK